MSEPREPRVYGPGELVKLELEPDEFNFLVTCVRKVSGPGISHELIHPLWLKLVTQANAPKPEPGVKADGLDAQAGIPLLSDVDPTDESVKNVASPLSRRPSA